MIRKTALALVLAIATTTASAQGVDTREGLRSFIENAALSALPGATGDLVQTFRAAPRIAKAGLGFWLRSRIVDAQLDGDVRAEDRYQAFLTCNDTGDCSRLAALQGAEGDDAAGTILPGRWYSRGGFGTVRLSAFGADLDGTYSSTYDSGAPGELSLTRHADGTWTGTWGEPAVGREGVLENVRVAPDGRSFRLDWKVTVAGRHGSRQLPMSSGSAGFEYQGE